MTALLLLAALAAERPNVLIVITDDQGYGDLACHGNPIIQTPNLDALHAKSVRLTDYHVDPTCSPTRSALMTGRYSTRTGVWHTIAGRSMMRPRERTIGEVFAAGGYATAAFGKWHLGDTRGLRSYDQGFPHALNHGGGGVTQTPDFWGNDYFDDVYNGSPAYNGERAEQFNGYCTDVWFEEAWDFINASAAASKENGGKPWLCYLATNAPHGPFIPPEGDRDEELKAAGLPGTMANFYAMIENIDTNMGRMLARLEAAGLLKDTLVVFTTDNGTAAGYEPPNPRRDKPERGFNAGMRGKKGSNYEGGHRVPCFWHWPGGGIGGGADVGRLTAHIDVLPTLVELCGLDAGDHPEWDGISLAADLRGEPTETDRTLFVHSQRIQTPQYGRNFAVMTERYRLCGNGDVGKAELYDVVADPGQQSDIAAEKPLVVRELTDAYQGWWESLEPSFEGYVRLQVDPEAGRASRITAHDWHPTGPGRYAELVPWSQSAVRQDPVARGWFALNVPEAGTYRVRGRMRPAGQLHALTAGTAAFSAGDVTADAAVEADALFGEVTVDLPAGDCRMEFTHTPSGGEATGYYFVEFVRVE